MAAGSLFTSGKFAIDPELRGAEFERITQNLDVHFWKSFWNLTETELLAVSAGAGDCPWHRARGRSGAQHRVPWGGGRGWSGTWHRALWGRGFQRCLVQGAVGLGCGVGAV